MQLDTNLLLHAIPAFLLLVIAENVYIIKEHHSYGTTKEVLASFALGIGYVFLAPFTKGINLLSYTFLYEHRLCDLSNHVFIAWIVCFIGDDFTYYWSHRLSHEIRFLWASHAVHHSAETFTLAAALRQSWTNNLTGTFLLWTWMPLFGISPAMLLFMKSVNVIYQFWLHTETIAKLPRWFEYIFNTPSHHRVHHGSNIEYLDKNHAGVLIIWDRIFHTYQEEIRKPKYGLTKPIHSNNPLIITFFEWKNLLSDLKHCSSLREYILYIFKAPGWKPKGRIGTSHALNQQLSIQNKASSFCDHNCITCILRLNQQ